MIEFWIGLALALGFGGIVGAFHYLSQQNKRLWKALGVEQRFRVGATNRLDIMCHDLDRRLEKLEEEE